MYAKMEKPQENKNRAAANSVSQKKSNAKQAGIDGTLVTQFADFRKRPIQRLVASIPTRTGEDDKIFMNTTLTAHAKVGGKIKKFSTCDFSDLKDFSTDAETLAITGHGSIAKIQDTTAVQIADALAHSTTGLNKSTHNIRFESCYSAISATANSNSLITTVNNKLKKERIDTGAWKSLPKISGSKGPGITTNKKAYGDTNPDIVKVVIEPANRKIAGQIQNCLKAGMSDVTKKQKVDFSTLIADAKKDQVEVRNFKLVFIEIAKGTPAGIDAIDGALRGKLKALWNSGSYIQDSGGKSAADIFETGLNITVNPPELTLN